MYGASKVKIIKRSLMSFLLRVVKNTLVGFSKWLFFCPSGTGLCLMELFSCQSCASSIGCSFLRFNIEDNVAYWEQKQMKKCFHFILVALSLLQHSHFVNFSLPFFSTYFMAIR